jgi:hypothetical protein
LQAKENKFVAAEDFPADSCYPQALFKSLFLCVQTRICYFLTGGNWMVIG